MNTKIRPFIALGLIVLLSACGGGGGGEDVINTSDNHPPFAYAGSDQEVAMGSTVKLSGSLSLDFDDDVLTYSWSFVSKPVDSSTALSDDTIINPSFTADKAGSYEIQLIVNDGTVDSAPATVTVTAVPPMAQPDTGQTTCYDALGVNIDCAGTGQDGEYAVNQPSYTVNGNGTVTDTVTGLMWQQQDDDTARTMSDAEAYCSGLALGGYTDWRMPSIKELNGIFDYGRFNPAIDVSVFLNTKSSSIYLSSSIQTYYYPDTGLWGIYASSGKDIAFSMTVEGVVRCVRNGSYAPQSLMDNGDGTVTDFATGLIWQKEDDNTTRTWEQSLAYCAGLELAGHGDWRLPNIKELRSIVLDIRWNPAIYTEYFPGTDSAYYWSSTTYAMTPSWGWGIQFLYGATGGEPKTAGKYVRCVR